MEIGIYGWFAIGALGLSALLGSIGIVGYWQDCRYNNSSTRGLGGRYVIRFRYKYFKGLEVRWKHEYQCFADANGKVGIREPGSVWGMNEYLRFAAKYDSYADAKGVYSFYEDGSILKMETVHNWKKGPIIVELLEERTYFGFFKSWYTLHSVEMK